MRFSSLMFAITVGACSTPTPGANPHEMSKAQHEASAQEEEKLAAAHAGQYDPAAARDVTRCNPNFANPRTPTALSGVCWSSTSNPTAQHLRDAEEHRRRAADHRAGSAALVAAEAKACAGVSEDDRGMSPFEHVEDIASVAPLMSRDRTQGAIITFRPVAGLTADGLQLVIDCHLARNASLGHQVPEMPDCPLVPRGVSAAVTSEGTSLLVTIRAGDTATAEEVLARARRLQAGPVR